MASACWRAKAIEDIDFDGMGDEAGTPHRPAAFASLTDREFEVAELIARGLDNKEIAATAYMGEGTVRNHISSILAKDGPAQPHADRHRLPARVISQRPTAPHSKMAAIDLMPFQNYAGLRG